VQLQSSNYTDFNAENQCKNQDFKFSSQEHAGP